MATTRKSSSGSRRASTTTTRGKNRNSSTGGSRSTSTSRARSSKSKASTRELAGGYAGGLIQAIKARPLTSAAIAGVAASAGAFLFAKRAGLSEQVSNLSDKVSEASSKLIGRDEESTGLDPASKAKAQRMTSGRKKSQSDIASEALTLKQTGESNNLPEQGKVGAIAY